MTVMYTYYPVFLNIALLLRGKKGCQNIYGIITSNKQEPTSKLKWLTTINTAPGLLKWNNVYHTPSK